MAKGIKNKITRLVLIISLTSLMLLFVFSSASILIIRNRSIDSNKTLGENAAFDSASALAEQSQKSLMFAAKTLATQSEEKLSYFSLYSKQISEYITNILENPDQYKPKEFKTSDKKNIILQYFNSYSEETSPQAKLIANADFLMENIVSNNSSITAVYFAGVDKSFIVANKEPMDTVDESDMTGESWFILAEKQGKTSFSDIVDDKMGRGKGFTCATPIYVNDIFIGVVGVGGLLTDVNSIISDVKLDYNGFAYVLNEKHKVIMGDESKDLDGMAEQTPNDDNTMVVAIHREKEVFLAYYKMPLLGWTVGAVYEVDAVLAKSYELLDKINALSLKSQKLIDQTVMATIFTFVGIVILTGIAVLAIGKSFASKLTNPILALNASIGEIDGKNINYKNQIRTNDEIQSLGESFEKMTLQIGNYIDNLAKVTAEKELISAELNVATQIQASMLPCIFPPFPDRKEFDIYAAMKPAKEVGGDFYDFFLIDNNHLAVIVADVSGKGVPAALFMVITKTLIKNAAQMGKSTAEIFTETNSQLCEGNEAGLFVTAWLGILEISSGKLSYSNAGHNPPLIKRKSGDYEYLRAKAGFVLAGMEGVKFRQFETTLDKGDELFLYTDGVTEATDSALQLLGEDRLLKYLNDCKGKNARYIIENIESEIELFVAGERQFDDITMLSLQIIDSMNFIEIDAVMENLEKVQEFAEQKLQSKNASQKVSFQVAIIIEELFINIVKYAYEGNGGIMKMCCDFNGDYLIMQFIDNGAMFNPLEFVADTTSALKDRKIGGLGLHMVKKSVDKMEYAYTNNQNVLTLTKKL